MTAPSELNVRVGEVLAGKYAIERVLGQGGMGAVLAVKHLMLDERRAVKLMLPSVMGGPQVVDRFFREARSAAKLRSEHVTKVHDVGLLPGGMPFIEMEYLEGMDLQVMLAQRGALPVPLVVEWMLQVCEALEEAHGAGIVHRDLKPANLFLTKRPNGTDCMKVLDFGIAKVQNGQDKSLTSTGTALGSPLYMSPEQMYGAANADMRSDIWSLGVILFQLLTNQVPFDGESVTAVALSVVNMPAPRPSSLRGGLPPALEAVVMRCLEKQAANRFPSVRELAQALRTVRDGGASVVASSAQGPQAGSAQGGAAAVGAVSSSGAHSTQMMDSGARAAFLARGEVGRGSMPSAPSFAQSGFGQPGFGQPLQASTLDAPVSTTMSPQQSKKSGAVPIAIGVLALAGALGAGVFFMRSRGEPPKKSKSAAEATAVEPAATAAADPVKPPAIGANAPASVASEAPTPVASETPSAVASDAPSVSAKPATGPGPVAVGRKRPPPPPVVMLPPPLPPPRKTGGFGGVD